MSNLLDETLRGPSLTFDISKIWKSSERLVTRNVPRVAATSSVSVSTTSVSANDDDYAKVLDNRMMKQVRVSSSKII